MSIPCAALSVATTIGKIAGLLAGNTGTIVRISQGVAFAANPSHGISVMNTSDTPVHLFFPGDGSIEASDILIPTGVSFDVTSEFNTYACGSNEQFYVTPAVPAPATLADAGAERPHVNIQASAQNVPAHMTVPLGFIHITINASDRTIVVAVTDTLTLAGLVLLKVSVGALGATLVNLCNESARLPLGVAEGSSRMTVTIPEGVDLTHGVQSLEVIVAVAQPSFAAAQEASFKKNAHLIAPLTETELYQLNA
jgi:hypothetical protein